MNLFERSIAYITRKKTRSIIILLILSIITSSIYACLSISRTTKNLEQKILTASNSSFTILKNPNTTGIETNDIIKNITNRNIKSINFKRSTEVQLQTGVVINQNQKIQLDNTGHNLSNLLKLHSVTNSNKENAFTSEAFTLIGGSHIDNTKGQRQVIIHEKLANKNSWKIGDKTIISKINSSLSVFSPVKSKKNLTDYLPISAKTPFMPVSIRTTSSIPPLSLSTSQKKSTKSSPKLKNLH